MYRIAYYPLPEIYVNIYACAYAAQRIYVWMYTCMCPSSRPSSIMIWGSYLSHCTQYVQVQSTPSPPSPIAADAPFPNAYSGWPPWPVGTVIQVSDPRCLCALTHGFNHSCLVPHPLLHCFPWQCLNASGTGLGTSYLATWGTQVRLMYEIYTRLQYISTFK